MSRRPVPSQDLSDPARVEELRRRLHEVVDEADAEALVVAELVLVALAEPQDLSSLLDAGQVLLAAALGAADAQEQHLTELSRRLADLHRTRTH